MQKRGMIMKTINATVLETEMTDGVLRRWFRVDGYDDGTGQDFDGQEFAITSDNVILDSNGCPLTEDDYETIAVRSVAGGIPVL